MYWRNQEHCQWFCVADESMTVQYRKSTRILLIEQSYIASVPILSTFQKATQEMNTFSNVNKRNQTTCWSNSKQPLQLSKYYEKNGLPWRSSCWWVIAVFITSMRSSFSSVVSIFIYLFLRFSMKFSIVILSIRTKSRTPSLDIILFMFFYTI